MPGIAGLAGVGSSMQTIGEKYAACMHSGQPSNSVSFFPAHMDKAFVSVAQFLPVQGNFWTIVAIPKSMDAGIPDDHSAAYSIWKDTLEESELQMVCNYEKHVQREALRSYGNTEAAKFRLVQFLCKPGCRLKFAAGQLCHGTIIPSSPKGRRMLIIHPLSLVN